MVSIVLPVYNEKDNILSLISEIDRYLSETDHEIIVMDDSSPDGTFDVVKNAARKGVYAHKRTKDRGLAASIRDGLEIAGGDILVVMDSDFNHKPEYLPYVISKLDSYGCVSGSRFLPGGGMDVRWRYLASKVFNIFARTITGIPFTDTLYGFLAFKKEAMVLMDKDWVFTGYGDYCMRLLYTMHKNNVSVHEFPAMNGRRLSGRSKSNFIKVFCGYFGEVVKLALRSRKGYCV